MKICPVCNDSFADELRFCDIDGARLTREAGSQDRNRWWSLLGAGLVVGALVISAATDVFVYTTPYFPNNRLPGDTVYYVAASLSYHAAWLTYLILSRRVRNTYQGD